MVVFEKMAFSKFMLSEIIAQKCSLTKICAFKFLQKLSQNLFAKFIAHHTNRININANKRVSMKHTRDFANDINPNCHAY